MYSKKMRLTSLLALVMAIVMVCSIISFGAIDMRKLITGKNGWYFYDDSGSVEDYQGTRFFSESELLKIKDNLLGIQQQLNSQGIQFVVFLAPNKETIYPEYMPDSYGAHADFTRIDQLYNYLKDDLQVVYPKYELMTAKYAYPQYNLYYMTDTHWNGLGGYIGARALATELGYSLPDLGSLSIHSDYFPNGDLTEELELPEGSDFTYTISGYGPYSTIIRDQDQYGNYFWDYTAQAPDISLTVYGDSYGIAMAPFLGQFFRNIYLHRFTTDTSLIAQEQPAVVVYEILERLLDEML